MEVLLTRYVEKAQFMVVIPKLFPSHLRARRAYAPTYPPTFRIVTKKQLKYFQFTLECLDKDLL
ncbi:hypothetical protein SADUNF_Sadunf10G0082000 [Salix dunnii]|uniref:Uncharacterized protein n=1 Tax=Salix dunnii TaxID=1413687 RepID=A0A835JMJ3_9ROSI|nr:hypothetical protein SADUNF_Sadunf10G0082000 [Salix dunnii]